MKKINNKKTNNILIFISIVVILIVFFFIYFKKFYYYNYVTKPLKVIEKTNNKYLSVETRESNVNFILVEDENIWNLVEVNNEYLITYSKKLNSDNFYLMEIKKLD